MWRVFTLVKLFDVDNHRYYDIQDTHILCYRSSLRRDPPPMLVRVTQGRGFYEHPVFGREAKTLRLDTPNYRLQPGAFWDSGVEEAAARLLAPSKPYMFLIAVSLAELLATLNGDIISQQRKTLLSQQPHPETVSVLRAPTTTSTIPRVRDKQWALTDPGDIKLPESHFSVEQFMKGLSFLERLGLAERLEQDEQIIYPTASLVTRIVEMEKSIVGP